MLPTSNGFGSPAASQGSAVGDDGGVRRSGRVVGDPAEAREWSEAHLHTLEGISDFWVALYFFFLSFTVLLSRCLWLSLAVCGGLVEVEGGCVKAVDASVLLCEKGELCDEFCVWVLSGCCWVCVLWVQKWK